MEVTVGIPLYKNSVSILMELLTSLSRQTFKNFNVILVHKEVPNDGIKELLGKFEDSLQLQRIVQKEGYFDEALNLLYSRSNADLLITTDGDAVPSRTWVQDHVRAHVKIPEAGVISPGSQGNSNKTGILQMAYSRILEQPLDAGMRKYGNYFSKGGLLVNNPHPLSSGDFSYTFNPIGVNMSVKREVYRGFRLIPFTLRGIGNEPYLCLHAYEEGYPCIKLKDDTCKIHHYDGNSLSRPKEVKGIVERFAEFSLSPYYVSKQYEVNLHFSMADIAIRTALWEMKADAEQMAKVKGLKLGVRLAKEGIEDKKDPAWIRDKLREIVQ
ncbi:hypothetical protein HS7_15490 [Sulfolobales archaeon HS-7]|nr:hypothetical protein HS7_15490 [Sulfolobales archaeon HS-7]